MEFVKVPAGEFKIVSPSGQEETYDNECPAHKVTIKEPFYLGKFEVTQKQWREVLGNNPSYFKEDDLPVEQVTWDDVQKFIKKLNEMEGTDKYRLPSEAEWEYACRAGTTTMYCFGDDESKLGDYARYDKNSGNKTHPVGQKKPNSWGLYDVYGNVREWCQDRQHDNYNGAPSDGSARESGSSSFRVLRGGSWYDLSGTCRSVARDWNYPDAQLRGLGFRVVKTLQLFLTLRLYYLCCKWK
jgi:formylglycine-generating enzyme required for sulfatase activity